mmetsp:Transcript_38901/g.82826  ORF Transcript_38901/g.82826 Transcript_38901/m.82826 type:complete len:254 (+) Transcript_38901:1148-1909(+)
MRLCSASIVARRWLPSSSKAWRCCLRNSSRARHCSCRKVSTLPAWLARLLMISPRKAARPVSNSRRCCRGSDSQAAPSSDWRPFSASQAEASSELRLCNAWMSLHTVATATKSSWRSSLDSLSFAACRALTSRPSFLSCSSKSAQRFAKRSSSAPTCIWEAMLASKSTKRFSKRSSSSLTSLSAARPAWSAIRPTLRSTRSVMTSSACTCCMWRSCTEVAKAMCSASMLRGKGLGVGSSIPSAEATAALAEPT